VIRSLKFQKLTLINHQVWQWVETQFPWDKIRGLGNSPIAKITGLIPVLGSILVFNYSFLAFLTFTELTSIPLVRIHLIYYGACLIGVASVVYALFCPTRIKK
jgi:hypothetical protein